MESFTISVRDLLPPPILLKGWRCVAESLTDAESNARYSNALVEWLDDYIGSTSWRHKVVLVDLVIPDPLSGEQGMSGFVLSRSIGAIEASELTRKHSDCVLALSGQSKSVGHHEVFLRSIPLFHGNYNVNPPDSYEQFQRMSKGKSIDDLATFNLLYGRTRDTSEITLDSSDEMAEHRFSIAGIGYKLPRNRQIGVELSGGHAQSLQDSWSTYLEIVRQEMPFIKAVVGLPLSTPSDFRSLEDPFLRIGHVFVGFVVDPRSENRWDRECLKLLRALTSLALASNLSFVRNELEIVAGLQMVSHETGDFLLSLDALKKSSTHIFSNSIQNQDVYNMCWRGFTDRHHLWKAGRDRASIATYLNRDTFRFEGGLESGLEAMWKHCVDYYCFVSLNTRKDIGNVHSKLLNAFKVSSTIDTCMLLENSDSAVKNELACLLLAVSAIMGDVLKHAFDSLLAGGKSDWRIDYEDRCIAITQVNNSVVQPTRFGFTSRIVMDLIDEISGEFKRIDKDGVHTDVLTLESGALFDRMVA